MSQVKQHILFILLAMSLGYSFSIQAFASEVCEIAQVENGGLAERSRIIRFADGRSITVIGHNHGDREYPIKLSTLTRASKSEVPTKELIGRVKALLSEGSKSVRDANEDLVYLKSQLETNSAIKFVGYEGIQRAAEENYDWMVGLQNRYYSQVWGQYTP